MKKIFFLPLLLLPVFIISFNPVNETDKIERAPGGTQLLRGLTGFHNNSETMAHLPSATKFNAVLFEEAVNKKMKNLVKGYAFAIGDKDGIKGRCAGGWAQDPADGNLKMSTKIPSCIGSVSKMLSGVAFLNLLEADPGVKLDDPVFSKLPKKWQQKYAGTQVECITYRQLLQHRSGFIFKSGDLKNLEELAKNPKSCPYEASRKYSNANISLLRYLITGLAFPQEVPAIEKKLAGLSFDEYAEQANIDYSFPYERYIRNNIFARGLMPITASCRPEPDFKTTVAKGYKDRNDTKGQLTNTAAQHIEKGNHCAPQGGWYLSAEMLIHFGRSLLFSNNYLTSTTRNMMFDEDKLNDRLCWASYESHAAFGKETGQTKWPWHDGAQDGYRAVLTQLPNGFVGAALINCDSVIGVNNPASYLEDVLMSSFYDATHSAPLAEIAKHGIAESIYQEEFSMIWNSGYYPVWVDGYDVNGKTFFNTIFRYNNNNYDVAVRHDMTKESFQTEYDDWVKKKGYRLQQLDNYNDAGKLKFAAIFIKKPGQAQAQPAYHALSPEEHQKLFEKYTGDGFVPVNVSVVSVGGKRYYSAFYEKRNVGGSVLKSFLSQQEYQDMYEDMDKKKWEQVYINAYQHDGQTRFSVIWYEKSGYQNTSATRKSNSDGYQDKWEDNTAKGLLTRCVTGYEEGGKQWFAAQWAK